jgi:ubiquinol oxidase
MEIPHDTPKNVEALNKELNDPQLRREYAAPYDNYDPGLLARTLGGAFVWAGDLVYGKEPSYLKFRAIELVARVPYHSWEAAVYTLLTLFFADERKALRFSRIAAFSRIAQDNETMHVVVISHLTRQENGGGFIRRTLIPVTFAFIYFWIAYLLYLLSRRSALELNYVFEDHAYRQYDRFLVLNEEELRHKPVDSEFLQWCGRNPRSQYEFFESVRNDELIHRNTSIREIPFHQGT